jgi:hypothetical protein
MSAMHTPGPWAIHERFPDYIVPLDHAGRKCGAAADDEVDLREYAQTIASVQSGKRHRTPEEVSANARLIAASPDLLEALKDAVGALEFSRDYHSDLSNAEQAFAQDKLDKALAAIAKARGEA